MRRILLGFDDDAGLAFGQIDAERGAAAFFAGNGNRAVMIADDGLHDGEAEACAELLGRVIRGEEARALFGREAFAGVGYFDADGFAGIAAFQGDGAAGRHGVESVEDEILKRAMKEIRSRRQFPAAIR